MQSLAAYPPTAIRTRPLFELRLTGANEHCDDVALALLCTELADESDVALSECSTGTSRGDAAGFVARLLFLVGGGSHTSGSSSISGSMAACATRPN